MSPPRLHHKQSLSYTASRQSMLLIRFSWTVTGRANFSTSGSTLARMENVAAAEALWAGDESEDTLVQLGTTGRYRPTDCTTIGWAGMIQASVARSGKRSMDDHAYPQLCFTKSRIRSQPVIIM